MEEFQHRRFMVEKVQGDRKVERFVTNVRKMILEIIVAKEWFQQALAGLIALACLVGLFFALLHWRVNTPGLHLNLGNAAYERLDGQKHE